MSAQLIGTLRLHGAASRVSQIVLCMNKRLKLVSREGADPGRMTRSSAPIASFAECDKNCEGDGDLDSLLMLWGHGNLCVAKTLSELMMESPKLAE
jgi:hypothetical protein